MSRVRPKDFDYYTLKKYDGMMGRCYRKNDPSFKNYGGRGIKVTSAWIARISNFRAWVYAELAEMGVAVDAFIKTPGQFQLDRIDPEGHYTPENCRLVDAQTNTRNRRLSKGKKITSAEGDEYVF